jgi:hypothetical protein
MAVRSTSGRLAVAGAVDADFFAAWFWAPQE